MFTLSKIISYYSEIVTKGEVNSMDFLFRPAVLMIFDVFGFVLHYLISVGWWCDSLLYRFIIYQTLNPAKCSSYEIRLSVDNGKLQLVIVVFVSGSGNLDLKSAVLNLVPSSLHRFHNRGMDRFI